MKLAHFFIPHPQTHKKAHLISIPAFGVYLLLFILLQFSINTFNKSHPGVLGISSNVDQKELIDLTNKERQNYGLETLVEDERLNQAALEKGKNMLAEDYWAHYAPSGKTPWDFIKASGYKFSYAGENLARNFYQSNEVVVAWMSSPTHKENILNAHYRNIGIAVLKGTLKGQKTILVVQAFGTPTDYVVSAPQAPTEKQITDLSERAVKSEGLSLGVGQQTATKTLFDPFQMTRNLALIIILMIGVLIGLDAYILKKRGVFRISSCHISHLALLSVAASVLINTSPGSIL